MVVFKPKSIVMSASSFCFRASKSTSTLLSEAALRIPSDIEICTSYARLVLNETWLISSWANRLLSSGTWLSFVMNVPPSWLKVPLPLSFSSSYSTPTDVLPEKLVYSSGSSDIPTSTTWFVSVTAIDDNAEGENDGEKGENEGVEDGVPGYCSELNASEVSSMVNEWKECQLNVYVYSNMCIASQNQDTKSEIQTWIEKVKCWIPSNWHERKLILFCCCRVNKCTVGSCIGSIKLFMVSTHKYKFSMYPDLINTTTTRWSIFV